MFTLSRYLEEKSRGSKSDIYTSVVSTLFAVVHSEEKTKNRVKNDTVLESHRKCVNANRTKRSAQTCGGLFAVGAIYQWWCNHLILEENDLCHKIHKWKESFLYFVTFWRGGGNYGQSTSQKRNTNIQYFPFFTLKCKMEKGNSKYCKSVSRFVRESVPFLCRDYRRSNKAG